MRVITLCLIPHSSASYRGREQNAKSDLQQKQVNTAADGCLLAPPQSRVRRLRDEKVKNKKTRKLPAESGSLLLWRLSTSTSSCPSIISCPSFPSSLLARIKPRGPSTPLPGEIKQGRGSPYFQACLRTVTVPPPPLPSLHTFPLPAPLTQNLIPSLWPNPPPQPPP